MAGKLKKYALPLVPYLFLFWVFLKLGTAYRIADGDMFWKKLAGLPHSINAAFGTIAPGTDGFDWLVGLIGAGIVWLAVQYKKQNAKKFRTDREYGTARWSA